MTYQPKSAQEAFEIFTMVMQGCDIDHREIQLARIAFASGMLAGAKLAANINNPAKLQEQTHAVCMKIESENETDH